MGGEADGEQETFTRNRRARGSCEGCVPTRTKGETIWTLSQQGTR